MRPSTLVCRDSTLLASAFSLPIAMSPNLLVAEITTTKFCYGTIPAGRELAEVELAVVRGMRDPFDARNFVAHEVEGQACPARRNGHRRIILGSALQEWSPRFFRQGCPC